MLHAEYVPHIARQNLVVGIGLCICVCVHPYVCVACECAVPSLYFLCTCRTQDSYALKCLICPQPNHAHM
jgi:hypothetical protein